MKKLLHVLMGFILALPPLWAQNPTIYIHNCTTSAELNQNLTPEAAQSDPQMKYDASTGNYTYEVIGWPKMNGSSAYNAKIFYSVDGDAITYYGCSGSMVMLQFNSGDTKSYGLVSSDKITGVKGALVYNTGSTESYCDVRITLNVEKSTIEFTKFEGGQEVEIPVLESVSPEVNSTVTPADDGSVTIKLTFSGKIKSLEALVDGTEINKATKEVWNKETNQYDTVETGWDNNIQSNDDGTEWTLIVAQELVETGANEDGGSLQITLEKVTSEEGYNVTFDEAGSTKLTLTYLVTGISKTVNFNFTGNYDVLTVYNSKAVDEEDIEYLQGTNPVTWKGDSYEFPITSVMRYLFLVPEGYQVTVTTDQPAGDSKNPNWTEGIDWLLKKYVIDTGGDSGEITFVKVKQGKTLNVFAGSANATFTINVEDLSNLDNNLYLSSPKTQLTQGSSSNNYGAVLDVKKGNNSFNFVYGNKYLVPAEGKNTALTFDETTNQATFDIAEGFNGVENIMWSYSISQRGTLDFDIDLSSMTATLTYIAENIAPNLYISGSFNNNNPNNEKQYALPVDSDKLSEDEVVEYNGSFEIADQDLLSFYLSYDGGYVIPAGGSMTEVVFEEDPGYRGRYIYNGEITKAATSENAWLISGWEANELSIQVNWDANTIMMQYEVEVPDAWFIRGAFNNYDPKYKEEWGLTPVDGSEENGTYSGTFEVPAGEFSFNLLASFGSIFVPSSYEETPVKFMLGSYTGTTDSSYGDDEDLIYWVDKSWEGGQIKVTVDANEGTLTIENLNYISALYISGEFNDNNPGNNSDWALNPDEDAAENNQNIYNGYFTIPEGEFNLNFVAGNKYLVPALDKDAVPVFEMDENKYNYVATVNCVESDNATTFWTYEGWEEAELTVSVDLDNLTITFQYPVPQDNNYYISGAFNNYNPNGEAKWTMQPNEYGEVYSCTVEVAVGEFSFNILAPNYQVVVPAEMDPDEGYAMPVKDWTVEFDDQVFTGLFAGVYDDDPQAEYYWVNEAWDGGEIMVSIDVNESTITIKDLNKYDSISALQNDKNVEAVYNLQGVKVSKDNLRKGIYIVNGKKVLVK